MYDLEGGIIKKVVKPSQRRELAKAMMKQGQHSERKACELMSIPRRVYRYRSKCADKDEQLKQRLLEHAQTYPRYGYLMLHGLLKREGLVVNKKRTYRLYTQAKLQIRTKRRKKLYRSRCIMPTPSAVNKRWSMDFVHDQLGDGRRFRVLNIVDDFSRECIAQICDVSISGMRVAQSLSQLIDRRGKPDSIVCDNGTEFTSKALFYWSQDKQVKLSFIQPGKPTQNAFVESFNGKFRDSCLNQYWFRSLADARMTIDNWRKDYNEVRPHSALGYQPPSVFAEKSA